MIDTLSPPNQAYIRKLCLETFHQPIPDLEPFITRGELDKKAFTKHVSSLPPSKDIVDNTTPISFTISDAVKAKWDMCRESSGTELARLRQQYQRTTENKDGYLDEIRSLNNILIETARRIELLSHTPQTVFPIEEHLKTLTELGYKVKNTNPETFEVETKEITLTALGMASKFMGKYTLRMSFSLSSNSRLYVTRIDEYRKLGVCSRDGFVHPFVSTSEGKLCFGNEQTRADKAWSDRNVSGFVLIAMSILEHYNPNANPYVALHNFRTGAVGDTCPVCGSTDGDCDTRECDECGRVLHVGEHCEDCWCHICEEETGGHCNCCHECERTEDRCNCASEGE